VDTKYEFGMDENDELVLIDEIHTPDSSRFWQLVSYEERFKKGEEPQYFDKEFLRLWFKERCDPYKDEKLPNAPAELVEELSRRYIQIYEQITGEKFVCGEKPIGQRIERNLKSYAISSSTDLKMPDRCLAGVFRIEAIFRAHLGDESKIMSASHQTDDS
jgi:hypothetical protein